MHQTTSSLTSIAALRDDQHDGHLDARLDALEKQRERRSALRTRRSRELARLMGQRHDLKGVFALADFVDDSLRWSA